MNMYSIEKILLKNRLDEWYNQWEAHKNDIFDDSGNLMSETSKNKILDEKYAKVKVGNVYKLKKDIFVWSIELQESIKFRSDDEKYVAITNTVYDHRTLFGELVERNAFGCITKSEIEFSIADIEIEPTYASKEEFNYEMNRLHNPFFFDFVGFEDSSVTVSSQQ